MVYQISISRVRVHGVFYITTIMSEAECPEYRLTDPSLFICLVSLKRRCGVGVAAI